MSWSAAEWGSVSTAAQDPIFYLHHSNVDRLWDLWLAQGGVRPDPVIDSCWTGKTYSFFNEHGRAIRMNTCEIHPVDRAIRAVRRPDLGGAKAAGRRG